MASIQQLPTTSTVRHWLAMTNQDENGMREVIGATFVADEPTIFGTVKEDYVRREIDWYHSMSRRVDDMEPPVPEIWKKIASKDGTINSNYGWCIWSPENGRQLIRCTETLRENPYSRQAVMIYNRPSMHDDAFENGMSDFICTNAVQFLIRTVSVGEWPDGEKPHLHCIVQMRSNDAVFGYKNDLAWHRHVLDMMSKALNVPAGPIIWHAGSLHVYPRHDELVRQYRKDYLPGAM